jgi:hypothetical protein
MNATIEPVTTTNRAQGVAKINGIVVSLLDINNLLGGEGLRAVE